MHCNQKKGSKHGGLTHEKLTGPLNHFKGSNLLQLPVRIAVNSSRQLREGFNGTHVLEHLSSRWAHQCPLMKGLGRL